SSHTTCLAAIFLTVNATLGAGLLNIPHAFNDSGGIFCSLVVQTSSTFLTSDEITVETVNTSGQSSHTTCLAAIFLTVNATLGAGLLNIPHAFNDSGGIFCSLVVQTIFVILVIGSLLLLTYCIDISNATSFQDVVLAFCGPRAQHFCSIIIVLYSYGACITFVIIIGDQFDRIFLSLYGTNFNQFWYMSRTFTMSTTCALLVIPLSFSKKISFLKNASDETNVWVKTRPNTWTEVFYITPVLCFAYQVRFIALLINTLFCQLSWIPTYSGMRHRSSSIKITLTIIISILICYLSYTLTAIFGLITFGSDYIENDLMSNYDANHLFVLFAIIILIAKTITVYPLLLFCGRIAVEDFMQKLSEMFCTNLAFCDNSSRFEPLRRALIVLIWIITTIIIAIYIPNITIAIEFLGSGAILFIFIFPGLCFLNAVLIKDKILGVFILGLTLTQTID
ncbi:unnamed protein product, partial [Medioppia subpectinata]